VGLRKSMTYNRICQSVSARAELHELLDKGDVCDHAVGILETSRPQPSHSHFRHDGSGLRQRDCNLTCPVVGTAPQPVRTRSPTSPFFKLARRVKSETLLRVPDELDGQKGRVP
jgi:hypothetical protein